MIFIICCWVCVKCKVFSILISFSSLISEIWNGLTRLIDGQGSQHTIQKEDELGLKLCVATLISKWIRVWGLWTGLQIQRDSTALYLTVLCESSNMQLLMVSSLNTLAKDFLFPSGIDVLPVSMLTTVKLCAYQGNAHSFAISVLLARNGRKWDWWVNQRLNEQWKRWIPTLYNQPITII